MTLDEAIAHADTIGNDCDACAAEHRQLARWLRELRHLRTIRDKQVNMFIRMRDSALDEAKRHNEVVKDWMCDFNETAETETP